MSHSNTYRNETTLNLKTDRQERIERGLGRIARNGRFMASIEGGGQGDGIPCGKLSLVPDLVEIVAIQDQTDLVHSPETNEIARRLEVRRTNMVREGLKMRNDKITDCLTLKQHYAVMGVLDYRERALKIMGLSKSKKVQALCFELIEFYRLNVQKIS
jgi:hypothetical protein